MKTLEKLIYYVARFAFGLGSALALVCVFVIVANDPGLGRTAVVQPAEVVRLDPVIVTITADRFYAIQAEMRGRSILVRTPDQKASEG